MIDVIRDIILWFGAICGIVAFVAVHVLHWRIVQLETSIYERGLMQIMQGKRRVL